MTISNSIRPTPALSAASTRPLLHILETIAYTVASDPAAGRARKVCRKYQCAVAIATEKIQSRLPRGVWINAKTGAPFGVAELQRRMHQIRAQNCFFAAAGKPDDELARCMAWSRLDADALRKSRSVVDQIGLSRRNNGQYAVGDEVARPRQARHSRLRTPVFPFSPRNEVSRIRKGWNPLATRKPGVPPHVIDVEMGAHDDVDILGRNSGCMQLFEPAPLTPVKERPSSILMIAAAGIHQDDLSGASYQEALDCNHKKPCRRIVEPRGQPWEVLLDVSGRTIRQQFKRGKQRRFGFDDAGQGSRSGLPMRLVRLPIVSLLGRMH